MLISPLQTTDITHKLLMCWQEVLLAVNYLLTEGCQGRTTFYIGDEWSGLPSQWPLLPHKQFLSMLSSPTNYTTSLILDLIVAAFAVWKTSPFTVFLLHWFCMKLMHYWSISKPVAMQSYFHMIMHYPWCLQRTAAQTPDTKIHWRWSH